MEPISRSAKLLRDLIVCPSVTPREAGALSCLETALTSLGFEVHRPVFSDTGTPNVENLYARLGTSAPHFCFAGHTDVVPPGNKEEWRHNPFGAIIENGHLYGRGAVDMKGAIACFIAATQQFIKTCGEPAGSISFLITGDEEGPAINGTYKLLQWVKKRGETIDACIVGEPTNTDRVGDSIKIGRRGSLSGKLIVSGIQGHVAYPHLADNPINCLLDLLTALLEKSFDTGSKQFQPTNLEITSIDVGNSANNVIPSHATANFNVRFNDQWSGDLIQKEIECHLKSAIQEGNFRQGKSSRGLFQIEWIGRASCVFLTKNTQLTGLLSEAIETVTGRKPKFSTDGGTSDARFIKDYCPVIEFGLINQTMHQIDERTKLADLDVLTAIYSTFLTNFFTNAPQHLFSPEPDPNHHNR